MTINVPPETAIAINRIHRKHKQQMILDDSCSTLESWNDGKLQDFGDRAMSGGGKQQKPGIPPRAPIDHQSSSVSKASSEASMELDMIWAEEEATDHTSHETNAYSSSLSEIEKLEQSLDQDMIGILNNQASVTELRINAIQSYLKLKDDAVTKKKEVDRFLAAAPSDRPVSERFRLPRSAFSI